MHKYNIVRNIKLQRTLRNINYYTYSLMTYSFVISDPILKIQIRGFCTDYKILDDFLYAW